MRYGIEYVTTATSIRETVSDFATSITTGRLGTSGGSTASIEHWSSIGVGQIDTRIHPWAARSDWKSAGNCCAYLSGHHHRRQLPWWWICTAKAEDQDCANTMSTIDEFATELKRKWKWKSPHTIRQTCRDTKTYQNWIWIGFNFATERLNKKKQIVFPCKTTLTCF